MTLKVRAALALYAVLTVIDNLPGWMEAKRRNRRYVWDWGFIPA